MSSTWVQNEFKMSPNEFKHVYFCHFKAFFGLILDSKWWKIFCELILASFWTHFINFFKKWVLFELMSSFWTHFGLILSSKMSSRGVQNELTLKMSSWAHFRVQNESSQGPKWVHELILDSFWTHFSTACYSLILPANN